MAGFKEVTSPSLHEIGTYYKRFIDKPIAISVLKIKDGAGLIATYQRIGFIPITTLHAKR